MRTDHQRIWQKRKKKKRTKKEGEHPQKRKKGPGYQMNVEGAQNAALLILNRGGGTGKKKGKCKKNGAHLCLEKRPLAAGPLGL